MAGKGVREDAPEMDDFFDDEQELMAVADEATRAQEDRAEGDRTGGEQGEKSEPVAPKRKDKQQKPTQAKAAEKPGNQAPPFWMVVAIAAVALVLGIVIGYLIGSAATFAELSAASEQAATQQGADGSVEMPEGHPEVSVDGEGNATVEGEGGAAADGADVPAEDDPLTRANSYFDMGMAALNAAKDEESQAKAVDLFNQAVVFYDEYLAMHENPSATVDRAICVFYGGDHEGAIADLEAFTKKDATFAPAWANLGMFYESHDEKDKAVNAYEQALKAAEKEDAYGVGGYAQERLDALAGK